jgi:hypothetical protein
MRVAPAIVPTDAQGRALRGSRALIERIGGDDQVEGNLHGRVGGILYAVNEPAALFATGETVSFRFAVVA